MLAPLVTTYKMRLPILFFVIENIPSDSFMIATMCIAMLINFIDSGTLASLEFQKLARQSKRFPCPDIYKIKFIIIS